MRRSDHPSRPSAMTCCFFPSLKTLLTLTEGNPHVRTMSRISESVGRFSSDHHWPVLGDPRGYFPPHRSTACDVGVMSRRFSLYGLRAGPSAYEEARPTSSFGFLVFCTNLHQFSEPAD